MSALFIGRDHVIVAGVDNLHFLGRQIRELILEIEHALRPEAVEHGNLADCPRSESRADAIARCHIDRYTEECDIGAVEHAGWQANVARPTKGTSLRSGVLRLVLSVVIAMSFPQAAETHRRRPDGLVVQQIFRSTLPDGIALRTNPAPRTVQIMGASFAPSTLRRNRP